MTAQTNELTNFNVDVELEQVSTVDTERYPIFRLNGDLATLFERLETSDEASHKELAKKLKEEGKVREDDTIYSGESLVGEFLGTVPMWSLEAKENWETVVVEGKKVWVNQHYLFRNPKSGAMFGVHDARATLWVLEKILTNASNPSIKNPIVKIEYVGKIVGKDELKKHGVELKVGKEAHVCKVLTQKGTSMDKMASGVLNFVRDPRPNFGSEEKTDRFTQNIKNYERLASASIAQPAIEGHSHTQLSM
jgi:hypothetical protein